MLVFDPKQRITVDEALAHPYMERLHFAEDEPVGEPVKDFDFDFELYHGNNTQIKNNLTKMVE